MTELLKDWIYVSVIGMARITAAFTILPFMGMQFIPGFARGAIVLSVSWVLFVPLMDQLPELTPGDFSKAGLLMKEAFLGMIIGFIFGVPIWVAASVGFLIDNQRGLSMSATFDPMVGDQTSPLGMILARVLIVMFLSAGGFGVILGLTYESYSIWPVFSFYPHVGEAFALFSIDRMRHIAEMTFVLAAPISITLFMSDLGLGMVNRFAPQLNVFILSMAVKSGLASFLLLFYLTTLFEFMGKEVQEAQGLLTMIGKLLYP